jgi:hypothetical protein
LPTRLDEHAQQRRDKAFLPGLKMVVERLTKVAHGELN